MFVPNALQATNAGDRRQTLHPLGCKCGYDGRKQQKGKQGFFVGVAFDQRNDSFCGLPCRQDMGSAKNGYSSHDGPFAARTTQNIETGIVLPPRGGKPARTKRAAEHIKELPRDSIWMRNRSRDTALVTRERGCRWVENGAVFANCWRVFHSAPPEAWVGKQRP